MSVAYANTNNRIGQRQLGSYHRQNIYRAPAEPMPRASENPVHGLSGFGTSDLLAASESPLKPTLNANGTASQAPTGVLISSNHLFSAQGAATPQAPPANPTSVAVITPSATPGYVTISSGGGTVANPAAPDYVHEVTTWLTEQSLISGIPNYVPLLGAAVLLGMVWRPSSARR